MNKNSIIITLILCFSVFYTWFNISSMAGGDWHYLFPASLHGYILGVWGWDFSFNNGLGGTDIFLLGLNSYYIAGSYVLMNVLSLPWWFVERVMWYWPFLTISSFSSYFLYKKFFAKDQLGILAIIIFMTNTYTLMLIGGGQVGIAIAYSLSPLIVGLFCRIIANFQSDIKPYPFLPLILITGVVSGMQMFFDLRMVYITLSTVVLFSLFFISSIFSLKKLIYLLIPLLIAFLQNVFWIIPQSLLHQNPLLEMGDAYTTVDAVRFFSFANFENSLGLLHPNWPENVFGLVHFMQPEFILLPILAFSSLFFIGRQRNKEGKREDTYIIYFALLGLIGAFLAKGANDPFGGVYLWLFNHVPGFIMFRDPTKWYTLVAISYTVLIPYTLWHLGEWLAKKFKGPSRLFTAQNLVIALFLVFWLFTIRQAIMGQLTGTFKPHTVPQEYTKLETFLDAQNTFSRTFWIPSIQRYGFSSSNHPAISGEAFYQVSSVSGVVDNLKKPTTENILRDAGVKYVVVPYDSEGELFIKDRKYDNKMYLNTIESVSAVPWLKKISRFGRIAVFEIPNPKGHFWLVGKDGEEKSVSYVFINPTKYTVEIKNAQPGDTLVFSESYDKNWEVENPNVVSQRFEGLFNSFVLTKPGTYTLTVVYTSQKWVVVGIWISCFSAGILILIAVWLGRQSLLAWKKR